MNTSHSTPIADVANELLSDIGAGVAHFGGEIPSMTTPATVVATPEALEAAAAASNLAAAALGLANAAR